MKLAETTTLPLLAAPFPWFGGKLRCAHLVWHRFGDVANYCEPFFGSGAVLLGRPHSPRTETINDLDGFVANFWRAVKHDPDAAATFADNPVFENDLHARHAWLVSQTEGLPRRLEGDSDFYDAKIAGWWAWGICCWIGSGFCDGSGPWHVQDGKLIHVGSDGQGVQRKRPSFAAGGQGVNRKFPHLACGGKAVNRKKLQLGGFAHCLKPSP